MAKKKSLHLLFPPGTWLTKDGILTPLSHMKTKHLFHTLGMLRGVLCPGGGNTPSTIQPLCRPYDEMQLEMEKRHGRDWCQGLVSKERSDN